VKPPAVPGPSAAVAPPLPGPAAPGRIHIEFDERVPAEFVHLVEGRIIDDDSLDAWVDLPGNAELLRQGAARRELDREDLRENLWHSILAHASRRGRGLGSLVFDPTGDLIRMLDELSAREAEIDRRVAERLETYLPEGAAEIHAVVRLHLGGTWDARTHDDIYLNLSFLHDYAAPWFGGLEGILGHEITHIVHRQLDGPPEDAVTPEGLFAVALAQIHSEGIARHVQSGLLDGVYPPRTYAAFVALRYQEDLAGFSSALRHTEELREACLDRADAVTCRKLIQSGLWRGGETYAVGHGMAKAIESALGRKTLASTFAAGGAKFFELYVQATRMLPGLPRLSEAFEKALPGADAVLAGMRERWKVRREGRLAFERRDYAAAESAWRRVTALDPADAIGAYNLACALARLGDDGGALEWLERSIRLGYADRAFMASDPDLDSLREGRSYRRFLDLLGSVSPAPPNSSRK
jgi:tetratricopeptide (TPR) repeat protein